MGAIDNTSSVTLPQLANEFVNNVFWLPMLREFRQSQQPSILGKSPGAQTFIRQLDMELVKRMSQQGKAPLVESLLRQLSGQRPTPKQVNKTGAGESIDEWHRQYEVNQQTG